MIWDFEDEHYAHWWCAAPNKKEAYREARKVLKKNRQYNSGKKILNLRRNQQDELEEWMTHKSADKNRQ